MWTLIVCLVTAVVLVTMVLSVYSVARLTGGQRAPARAAAPRVEGISVLKPLCGADDSLEDNLAGFFVQEGATYELVFGVEGEGDPAVEVVRRLRERYPAVAVRLVIHDGGRALNPKVSNLQAMLGAADHDMVVVSDSNVAVPADWLARMAADFDAMDKPGLITNLFVGTGEESLGATFENLHLAGPVAGSIAASHVLGPNAATVGKSMMFRQSVLYGLGGLESLGSVLAEDYVMGRMFTEAGLSVRLATCPVANVCTNHRVSAFLKRHARWGLIRSRVMPLIYAAEPLFNPMLPVVLGLAHGGAVGDVLVTVGLLTTLARDAAQWIMLRGPRGLIRALPLGPIKELMILGVWVVTPFFGRVTWRGKRFRVGAGTRLYATAPISAPTRWSCE